MRPILILDCDEVLLQFAQPFARWLDETHGIELSFTRFTLAGSMRHADGRPVDRDSIPSLLDGFFAGGQHLQQPAEGVVDALRRLADAMDMVVLTNIGEAHRAQRAAVLAAHGLALPVIANRGDKGPAVARLAAGRPAALFVDDLPPHHESAAAHAPGVGRLHMVQDPALRGLIPAARHAHARIDCWDEAEAFVRRWMENAHDP